MGILRTDRIAGLGGANAIKGSAYLHGGDDSSGSQTMNMKDSSLAIGTNEFCCDFWMYWVDIPSHGVRVVGNINQGDYSTAQSWAYLRFADGTSRLWNGSSYVSTGADNFVANRWYHIAVIRNSGNNQALYIDGSMQSTTVSNTNNWTNDEFDINGRASDGAESARIFFSNVRLTIGSGASDLGGIVPVGESEVLADTKILCCNSPGNILNESAQGIPITTGRNSTANASVGTASRFTPNSPVGFSTTTDVGSQHGTTFNGFGNFATSTYMVPPGGNTRERNRGRAIMAGGMKYPTANTEIIEMLEIQSGGQTQDFGDLITATQTSGPVSSSTRAVIVAGLDPSARTNVIEFVTIANTGNAIDFGDYVEDLGYVGGVSNETRGVTCGGSGPSSPSGTNQMAYITIPTAGAATDFGDLSGNAQGAMGVQSSTRGVFNLGYVGGFVNTIEYITIASTGNATSFGTLSRTNSAFGGSCCSSTRGLFAGGYNNTPASVTEVNNIDYITIASTGNSTDFGDLVTAGFYCYGTSNKTRGIFQGRLTTAPTTGDPMIDSVIIASTGNAVEWGEMHRMDSGPADGQALKRRGATTMSDSHGGLS